MRALNPTMSEKLPIPHEFHPYQELLNEPVIVAYQGHSPSDRMNNMLGWGHDMSAVDTQAYVRCVRRHTAESDDRLTIIEEDDPYYSETFEELEMGEECRL